MESLQMENPIPFRKFEHRAPSHQNAVDIFAGKWAHDLGAASPGIKAGTTPLFTDDYRPRMLAQFLGVGGRLDNLSVLELGPLEGAHTYQLEKLGANPILAIEANIEAFLKCLIVKEILNLRAAKFMLGDFNEYLKETSDTYDVVMCSGVLYHMADPIELIRRIARVSRNCFVWTHYYDERHYLSVPREVRFDARYPGMKMYSLTYGDMDHDRFWGGNKPVSVWLEREDLLDAFRHAGFTSIEIIEDTPTHPNSACFTFAARCE
jgi:SAM-dependent methyltransferase